MCCPLQTNKLGSFCNMAPCVLVCFYCHCFHLDLTYWTLRTNSLASDPPMLIWLLSLPGQTVMRYQPSDHSRTDVVMKAKTALNYCTEQPIDLWFCSFMPVILASVEIFAVSPGCVQKELLSLESCFDFTQQLHFQLKIINHSRFI